jgi:hypothetical protein
MMQGRSLCDAAHEICQMILEVLTCIRSITGYFDMESMTKTTGSRSTKRKARQKSVHLRQSAKVEITISRTEAFEQ